MAINDYLGEKAQATQKSSQRGISRRGFLAGLGALAVGSALAYSPLAYSAEPAKQAQGLEKKIPAEYDEKDLDLLACDNPCVASESERAEYNRLGREYMKTLMKKGKYDPNRKEALKALVSYNNGFYNPKTRIEKRKKDLLREQDPEAYLKQYEEKKDIEMIRKISLNLKEYLKIEENKRKFENSREFSWKVNPDNPDLSDIIYIYDGLKDFKSAMETLGGMSGSGIGPISGNPLVR